jgi:DNA (cytosine-5)-methyltransferase 1
VELVDLFCGCGGLSLGAHNAGFETALAVDSDSNLRSAYRRNFVGRSVAGFDLQKVAGEALRARLRTRKLTGVIGGPPCQGFSVMGRSQKDDPRNTLVSKFLEIAISLEPAFFVMENVPGFLSDRHSALREAALSQIPQKYKIVGPVKLNAADYGGATNRERVVLIGYDPDYLDELSLSDLENAKLDRPRVTVGEALSGLVASKANTATDVGFDWVRLDRRCERSDYATSLHPSAPCRYLSKTARRLYSEGYVTGFQPTEHAPQTIKRFSETEPGKQETVSRYYRLAWDRTAPTLRAGTGSDRGSYQAARPIHPEEPRVITVREAARLQGFPDWFMFHPTKWHSHRMIGNSVSPIFAEAIMRVIASKLDMNENPHGKTYKVGRSADARASLALDVAGAK